MLPTIMKVAARGWLLTCAGRCGAAPLPVHGPLVPAHAAHRRIQGLQGPLPRFIPPVHFPVHLNSRAISARVFRDR